MHIYFSGIGGVALGPLALIAKDSGHNVSGSDISKSRYTQIMEDNGVPVYYDQSGEAIKNTHNRNKIDWFVMTSALPTDHPERIFAKENGIKISKRDELINQILDQNKLKLIAIAGTHGKTTTTGMIIWLFKQIKIPISYSVGTNISFGPSGQYKDKSEYFVYEADEFDRNFLAFKPYLSVIANVDYDHPDTYPNKQDYLEAFRQFCKQSKICIGLENDKQKLNCSNIEVSKDSTKQKILLPGAHNRSNAWLAVSAIHKLTSVDIPKLISIINDFPGTERRFEKLSINLYTDYAHHPAEIKATISAAKELSQNVVAIYQPHQNLRQYQIKDLYKDSFKDIKKVYWLPTYLSRESDLDILNPDDLIKYLDNPEVAEVAELNNKLIKSIDKHLANGDLVIAMGAGNIDEWLRANYSAKK